MSASRTQRTEKPFCGLLLLRLTFSLLLFRFRFHALEPLDEELHQFPLFPALLKFPLLLRLPPGKPAANAATHVQATRPVGRGSGLPDDVARRTKPWPRPFWLTNGRLCTQRSILEHLLLPTGKLLFNGNQQAGQMGHFFHRQGLDVHKDA